MKKLGHATNIKCFLTSPLEMNFMNMSLNALNLMVGMNGVGKSFINATIWALSTIINSKILSLIHKQPINDIEAAQFVIENTFNSPLTGTIGLGFDSSATIDVAIKEGKVLNVTFNCIEDIQEITGAIYMSPSFRTFPPISNYLTNRKNCGKTSHEEIINEMVKTYKLYDVMYVESLIAKMPLKLDVTTRAYLNGLGIREEIISFGVDLDVCAFFAISKEFGLQEKENKIYLHIWFGSGHQAIINMMLGGAVKI